MESNSWELLGLMESRVSRRDPSDQTLHSCIDGQQPSTGHTGIMRITVALSRMGFTDQSISLLPPRWKSLSVLSQPIPLSCRL
ncbi:hypothetical protein ACN38_g9115 [Penicillium nordicum]|uniref:Uncharacterized protein n=1 Tax=Penicillium nordicum TaxID=229535 RepID=A0A0M8NYS5_9EURO|nr:hypothetical protein ACN38_g9115 [Penicillium nordicum]